MDEDRKVNGVENEVEDVITEQLHRPRLLALSYPQRVLSKEIWERVLRMDKERLERLDSR